MFIPQDDLNVIYPGTTMCAWGADQKRRRLAAEVAREISETVFWAYYQPLANTG